MPTNAMVLPSESAGQNDIHIDGDHMCLTWGVHVTYGRLHKSILGLAASSSALARFAAHAALVRAASSAALFRASLTAALFRASLTAAP
jgi:hypothetical protein